MSDVQVLPQRHEVPAAQTWHKESVFADAAAWESEFNAVKAHLPELAKFEGTLHTSPAHLADWLEQSSLMRRRIMKLYFYCAMSAEVDAGDTTAKQQMGQAMGLYGRWAGIESFQNPELIAIGEATLQDWLTQEPRLQLYRQALHNLFRQQQHVRSAEVEELLGMLSDPFGSSRRIASELTNTDLIFAEANDTSGRIHQVTQSSIGTLLQSPDRILRRSAWENYADAHLRFQNTLATSYITSVKQSVFQMQARHYESVLEMQLFEYNLPTSVFHNLIETYQKHLPLWQRYWDVKRRALGYETLHPYDIWAPLLADEPPVSFEQAVEWIAAGMQPLGQAYVDVLRRGCLEQRWVDYAPNIGKRQGAFSFGTYDTHPFIMMSFDNSLKGLSTLAHELGHSLHSYLTRHSQPEVYGDYSMFVAEVASNFNQALTRAYLFEAQKDNRAFQIALIEEAMANFHRYFFIMPTLARLELAVHTRVEQGKPVTAETLCSLMSELYAEGYGSTLTDDPVRTGITWAQFSHLYSPYYTFQYATGISAAHAIADLVLNGASNAAENYLQALRAGSSLYPLDTLKVAGVDMNTPAAVEKTFDILRQMVDRLEQLTTR
jgi:oligoendopeptidase F